MRVSSQENFQKLLKNSKVLTKMDPVTYTISLNQPDILYHQNIYIGVKHPSMIVNFIAVC